MIVVDTSVLVDFFRGRETRATRRLEELERSDVPFSIPTVCCQELLQGARDEAEWSTLHDYLGTQRLLSPSDPWRTHVEAARIYFEGRRRGLTIRSTVDCFIAALTLEMAGTLLHDDIDFERIKAIRDLPTLGGPALGEG